MAGGCATRRSKPQLIPSFVLRENLAQHTKRATGEPLRRRIPIRKITNVAIDLTSSGIIFATRLRSRSPKIPGPLALMEARSC